ncbi:hypothetical protein ACOME3_009620 [Neoechinorhynchus agilis]
MKLSLLKSLRIKGILRRKPNKMSQSIRTMNVSCKDMSDGFIVDDSELHVHAINHISRSEMSKYQSLQRLIKCTSHLSESRIPCLSNKLCNVILITRSSEEITLKHLLRSEDSVLVHARQMRKSLIIENQKIDFNNISPCNKSECYISKSYSSVREPRLVDHSRTINACRYSSDVAKNVSDNKSVHYGDRRPIGCRCERGLPLRLKSSTAPIYVSEKRGSNAKGEASYVKDASNGPNGANHEAAQMTFNGIFVVDETFKGKRTNSRDVSEIRCNSALNRPYSNDIYNKDTRKKAEKQPQCKQTTESSRDSKVDWGLSELAYRNTPHALIGQSPSQMMMGRRIPILFDNLKQDPRKTERNKRIREKSNHDKKARKFEKFNGKSAVWYRDARYKKWIPASVSERKGPLSYKVETNQGIKKVHAGHLVHREIESAAQVGLKDETGEEVEDMVPHVEQREEKEEDRRADEVSEQNEPLDQKVEYNEDELTDQKEDMVFRPRGSSRVPSKPFTTNRVCVAGAGGAFLSE